MWYSACYMQIPYRKPGKFASQKPDPIMTEKKFVELQSKLAHLKHIRPAAAAEVARLAELGDFSENAEYQLAKGRLRGINANIVKLEFEINNAEVIGSASKSGTVEVGSVVTVEVEGKEKQFEILGSSETNPSKGIISYTSPLGSALLHAATGETVEVLIGGKTKLYTIKKIS